MASSLALKEFVHVLIHLCPCHLGSGACRELPRFPERSTFLVLNLEVGVARLESVDLLGAHGLVLVKLPHALDHAHHLVHAGLGPALRGGVAHEVLQTERQFLNKGNVFVLRVRYYFSYDLQCLGLYLNALPAISAPCKKILGGFVDSWTKSETGWSAEVNHPGPLTLKIPTLRQLTRRSRQGAMQWWKYEVITGNELKFDEINQVRRLQPMF